MPQAEKEIKNDTLAEKKLNMSSQRGGK